jgi:hypothetical protein
MHRPRPLLKVLTCGTVILALACLTGAVVAGPALAGHRHHHHKKHKPLLKPTVENICAVTPRLGHVNYTTYTEPTGKTDDVAYWDNNRDTIPDFMAIDLTGDTLVDAALWVEDDSITYLAICPAGAWETASEIEAAAQQATTSPSAGTGSDASTYLELDNIASEIGGINGTTPDGPGCSGSVDLDGGSFCTDG